MLRQKKKKFTSKTTSTPVPIRRSQSPYELNSSPIQLNTTYSKVSTICSDGMISPSQESQSPILQSSIPTENTTPAKKKKPKLAKVKIYHAKTADKRKTAKRAVAAVNSAAPEVASAEEVCDEAPLPKRRRLRESVSKRRGAETEERKPGQFPCKSVKVVGGSTIDLRVIYKSESARWSKTGDINYSVGTTTEQFKWGLLEILGGGVKPTSLSKDWMVFNLMSGSVRINLDSQLIGTLDKVGDTFLVPPESTYEFNNLNSKKAVLSYMIIMQT